MSRSVPYFKIRRCQAYHVQGRESILLSSFDIKCWQTFWVNLSSTTGRESSWLTSCCFILGCLRNTTVCLHQCDWRLPICSFLIELFHPISSLLAGWDHPTESKSNWRGAERIGDSTLREGLHLRRLLSKLQLWVSCIYLFAWWRAGIILLIAS